MLRIRKFDRVKVLWGKDRGKEGEVLSVDPKKDRVLVAKINVAKRHSRPMGKMDTGGIKDKELWLPRAKVMLICPDTKKPTRPKVDFLTDGTKIRVDRKTNAVIPDPKRK